MKLVNAWLRTWLGLLEGVAISLAFWWGLWLLLPGHTFDASQAYQPMAQAGPEELWGVLFVGAALLTLYGVLFQHYRLAGTGLILLVALWVFVFVALSLGNWRTTATPVYIHLAAAYAWLWLQEVRRA